MVSVPVRKLNTHIIPHHACEERKPSARWACRVLEAAPTENKKKPLAHHKLASELQGSKAASPLTSKGLFFKKEGKFDQMWMVKWYDWFKYVIAFTRKAFDFTAGVAKTIIGILQQAESAKTMRAA